MVKLRSLSLNIKNDFFLLVNVADNKINNEILIIFIFLNELNITR